MFEALAGAEDKYEAHQIAMQFSGYETEAARQEARDEAAIAHRLREIRGEELLPPDYVAPEGSSMA